MPAKPTYEELERKVKELGGKTESFVAKEETLRTTLEERIRFEKLLTDLSAIFVSMPANEIDGEIEGVLRRVGEVLEIDRSSFVQFSQELGQIQITHSWAADGAEAWPHIIPSEYFPWLTEKLLHGEIVAFSSPDELPKEAARDRKTLQRGGQKSGLLIPYFLKGSFLFAIAFGTVHSRWSWPEDLIQRLRFLGEIVSNALIRKQADLELQKTNEEQLKFERLLTELSAAFVKIPADKVDEKVEAVLQRIGEILGVDRTDFVQLMTETGKVEIPHSWTAKGIERYDQIITDDHYPWFTENLRNGKDIIFATDDMPREAEKDKKSLENMGIKSGMIIPYMVEGSFVCATAFGSHRDCRPSWPEEHIQRLRLLGEVIFNALLHKQADLKLCKAFSEIKELKDRLRWSTKNK